MLPSTCQLIQALVETALNTKKYYCTALIQIDFQFSLVGFKNGAGDTDVEW